MGLNWKEVSGGNKTYLSASKMQDNQVLEGNYIESKTDAKYGNQVYVLNTEDGEVHMNGCGHLDFLMKSVAPGSNVRITYLGKSKIDSGAMAGKLANKFKVEVAEEI